jgi:RHS repeat-associated protein
VVAYYLADHLGSIVRETDAAGVVSLTRKYDPYGNQVEGNATGGYAYTAREWDPEINLYYYRARFYDPKIGRFISEDPTGQRGGPNLYRYVRNSPVLFSDPSGLLEKPPGGMWCGPNIPITGPPTPLDCVKPEEAKRNVKRLIAWFCKRKSGDSYENPPGSQPAGGWDDGPDGNLAPWILPSGSNYVDYCRCAHEYNHAENISKNLSNNELECLAYKAQLKCLENYCCQK